MRFEEENLKKMFHLGLRMQQSLILSTLTNFVPLQLLLLISEISFSEQGLEQLNMSIIHIDN